MPSHVVGMNALEVQQQSAYSWFSPLCSREQIQ
jgi:hypothetical protein